MTTLAHTEGTVVPPVFGGTTAWWQARPAGSDAAIAEGQAVQARDGEVEVVSDATPSGRLAFRALVAFTFILLLSPQIWFPVLGTMRIAFLAAGVAILAHVMDRTLQRVAVTPPSKEIKLALMLVGWSIATLPLSYWVSGSVEILTEHYLKAVAFFWLIGSIVISVRRLRTLAWVLMICSIPLAVTGFKNYLSGMFLKTGVAGFYRIYGYAGGSGLVGNPNDLALMLNLIIPITVALAMSTRSKALRLLCVAAIILSGITVIVTFSRAGFLTLATTLVMFVIATMRRGRSPGTAVAVLVGALAMLPLMPSGYADRLSTIADVDADATGSAQGRWKDAGVAVGVVLSHPVVGVGLGQDILAMNESRGEKWTRVHNAYLQSAVDLGIPGFLLFVCLHLACYKSAKRVERLCVERPDLRELGHLALGVQISLIAFGVAAMFHPIAYQFYFFTIAGLAVALKNAYDTAVGPLADGDPSVSTAEPVPQFS